MRWFPAAVRTWRTSGRRSLYRIFGFSQGAEEPVGEIDQLAPLARDRVHAWVGPGVSWPGSGGHVLRLPWSDLPSPVRQDSAPDCEAVAPPHIPGGCVVGLPR